MYKIARNFVYYLKYSAIFLTSELNNEKKAVSINAFSKNKIH